MNAHDHAYIGSPLGRMLLVAGPDGLERINFQEADGALAPPPDSREMPNEHLERAASELSDYYAGRLRQFTVALAPRGTDFQRKVWQALRGIPYGETVSYRHIAEAIGRPTACRAVGAANGRNPLPVIVPCHRVIGTSGALTGYYGGVHIKQRLLDIETGNSVLPGLASP